MTKWLVGRISSRSSRNLARVKGSNTKPEIELRKLLFSRGLRFRLHRNDLPGKPDIVFVGRRVAVFCDGDFWHGRGWDQEHSPKMFKVRTRFWVEKIERNIARDRQVNRKLRKAGFLVLRFWESDIYKNGAKIADRVAKIVRARGNIRSH